LPGAVEFELGIPAAAVEGYQKGGYKGAVQAMVERYSLGKMLQGAGFLNRPSRMAVLSGTAFAEAKAEGQSTPEAAKSAAVMGLLSLPGGREEKHR
jgi:hypothetical protein